MLADLIWPPAVLTLGLYATPPVLLGLLAEWVILWRAWKVPARTAGLFVIAANAVSTLAGFLALPILLGPMWSLVFDEIDGKGASWFYYVALIASPVAAVFLNTGIEGAVLRWGFRRSLSRASLLPLLAANAVSAVMIVIALLLGIGDDWLNRMTR